MALQTYVLVVSGNLAGQFVQNVFHYRLDDAAAPTKLKAAKSLVAGWEAASKPSNLLDCLPGAYTWLSTKARLVTSGGGAEWASLENQGDTGTRPGDIQASSSGPVVTWFTDGPNRRIGKTFLPGIRSLDVVDGEISVGFITLINTRMGTFRANFDTVGELVTTAQFVIAKSGDPTTRSLVVNNNVSKDVGVQRRRVLPV